MFHDLAKKSLDDTFWFSYFMLLCLMKKHLVCSWLDLHIDLRIGSLLVLRCHLCLAHGLAQTLRTSGLNHVKLVLRVDNLIAHLAFLSLVIVRPASLHLRCCVFHSLLVWISVVRQVALRCFVREFLGR